jgi:hypothetical protein
VGQIEDAMTELLKIGKTRRISREQPKPIRTRDELYREYTTDVRQPDPPHYGAAVDTFELLHSLLQRIHRLSESGTFETLIGEEFVLVGEISGGTCKAHITNMVSYVDLPLPKFQWLLVALVGELSQSIRAAGVDFDLYMDRFPATLEPAKKWSDYFDSKPPPKAY